MKFILALIITAVVSIGIGFAIVKYPDFIHSKNTQVSVDQKNNSAQATIMPTASPSPTLIPIDDHTDLSAEIGKLSPPDTKADFTELTTLLKNF